QLLDVREDDDPGIRPLLDGLPHESRDDQALAAGGRDHNERVARTLLPIGRDGIDRGALVGAELHQSLSSLALWGISSPTCSGENPSRHVEPSGMRYSTQSGPASICSPGTRSGC